MHESMLEHYNLVQRKCISNTKVYKDVLIYRKDYTLSKLEKHFLNFLCNQKETMYDANRKETMYDANRKRRSNIESNLLFRFVYKHYLDDKYSSMAMAAILPAPIAEITVAAPVTASPPA